MLRGAIGGNAAAVVGDSGPACHSVCVQLDSSRGVLVVQVD